MDDLGWRFWGSLIGGIVAVCLGGWLLFLIMGYAWYAWGALAALVFTMVLVVGIAYVADRALTRRAGY